MSSDAKSFAQQNDVTLRIVHDFPGPWLFKFFPFIFVCHKLQKNQNH